VIPVPDIGEWWRAAVGAAVIAPLCLVLGHCHGVDAQKTRERGAAAEAGLRGAQVQGKALEDAATRRGEDKAAVGAAQKERDDATAPIPDTLPSERRRIRGCIQLRQQGHDLATIPRCRGLAPGAQATA
jgi:hypothetical protein